ncbi:hypothetical protein JHK85_000688 [Glycine max]|nr:hypothetical protein JHK85_000688 [Glycine max]
MDEVDGLCAVRVSIQLRICEDCTIFSGSGLLEDLCRPMNCHHCSMLHLQEIEKNLTKQESNGCGVRAIDDGGGCRPRDSATDKGSYEKRPSSFAPKAYEMEGSCSSKINNIKNDTNLMSNSSNKDMFLDSYTTSWQRYERDDDHQRRDRIADKNSNLDRSIHKSQFLECLTLGRVIFTLTKEELYLVLSNIVLTYFALENFLCIVCTVDLKRYARQPSPVIVEQQQRDLEDKHGDRRSV